MLAARGQHQDCWLLWWPVPARRVLWAHLFLTLTGSLNQISPKYWERKTWTTNAIVPCIHSMAFGSMGTDVRERSNWPKKADRLWLIFLCTLLDCCSNDVCKINLGERSAWVESLYDSLHLRFAHCIGFLWLTTNYRLEVRLGEVGRRWVKSKVQGRLCSFLESLAENLFPGLFQLLEAACIPWLVVPSFTFKTSSTALIWSLFCHHLSDYSRETSNFKNIRGDFSGGPVAKTLNAGDLGSIPGQGTRSLTLQLRVQLPRLKGPMCRN